MITHLWADAVPDEHQPAVDGLLALAAAADLEPGFPVPGDAGRVLLTWLVEDDGVELAAVTRLLPDGSLEHTVRPELRALGITTLLVEQLGIDLGAGVRPLSAWAVGDHPAAERLWRRWRSQGLAVGRRQWQLVGLLRGLAVSGTDFAEADEQQRKEVSTWPGLEDVDAEVVLVDPALSTAALLSPSQEMDTDYGRSAHLHAVRGERVSAGLAAAVAVVLDAGLDVADLTIGSDEDELLTACRELGFSHYRTNVEYVLA